MPINTRTPPILLESGDRLGRAEFHRRYCLSAERVHAELVQGVVYVASPVRATAHGKPHADMMLWLGTFAALDRGMRLVDNATIFLDEDTELQPDGALFRDPPPGPGAARITAEDYIEGAPQLVVEIAASSASYDLHDKLRAYERAGVPEYVVWRTLDVNLDWFRLHDGAYVRVAPNERGVIESAVFPGLRLHVGKLLAGDMAGVLAEMERRAEG
ncbi:MAG: Uma2 family endonuclease [Dehalococcoidia bacterium]